MLAGWSLLELLEAENAKLSDCVVELALEIRKILEGNYVVWEAFPNVTASSYRFSLSHG
jgi:hypothetical protein